MRAAANATAAALDAVEKAAWADVESADAAGLPLDLREAWAATAACDACPRGANIPIDVHYGNAKFPPRGVPLKQIRILLERHVAQATGGKFGLVDEYNTSSVVRQERGEGASG